MALDPGELGGAPLGDDVENLSAESDGWVVDFPNHAPVAIVQA